MTKLVALLRGINVGGFRIEKDFQDRWTFLRPDGIAVPAFGYSSRDMIDEELYPKGTWSDMVEIPPAGGLLSGGENKVSEPPPPAYLHWFCPSGLKNKLI